MKLDGIDKKILRELIADSRKPILEISRNIGISGAAIHQRIKKLNENKLISGQHLKVNPKILGYTTLAFIGIYFDKAERNSEAIKKMKEIPEILEFWKVEAFRSDERWGHATNGDGPFKSQESQESHYFLCVF